MSIGRLPTSGGIGRGSSLSPAPRNRRRSRCETPNGNRPATSPVGACAPRPMPVPSPTPVFLVGSIGRPSPALRPSSKQAPRRPGIPSTDRAGADITAATPSAPGCLPAIVSANRHPAGSPRPARAPMPTIPRGPAAPAPAGRRIDLKHRQRPAAVCSADAFLFAHDDQAEPRTQLAAWPARV